MESAERKKQSSAYHKQNQRAHSVLNSRERDFKPLSKKKKETFEGGIQRRGGEHSRYDELAGLRHLQSRYAHAWRDMIGPRNTKTKTKTKKKVEEEHQQPGRHHKKEIAESTRAVANLHHSNARQRWRAGKRKSTINAPSLQLQLTNNTRKAKRKRKGKRVE